MDKGPGSSLFVNDGSFMERFKRLQQDQKEKISASKDTQSSVNSSVASRSTHTIAKPNSESKINEKRKAAAPISSAGKLAFSLKQKSKLAAAPVKLGADEDEDEEDGENKQGDGLEKRQKLGQSETSGQMLEQRVVAPSPPSDPEVKKVADKLASFVAKVGRQFEDVTRQKNPGDTPFKFLFDRGCSDYKYYEYRLIEEEKALAPTKDSQTLLSGSPSTTNSKALSHSQRNQSNYQIPASALYDANEDTRYPISSNLATSVGGSSSYGSRKNVMRAMPYAGLRIELSLGKCECVQLKKI